MAAGIGFVPEDRQQQGLVMEMTVTRNATLTVLREVQRFGLVSHKKEREIARRWTGAYAAERPYRGAGSNLVGW